jgi:hypothetical protein
MKHKSHRSTPLKKRKRSGGSTSDAVTALAVGIPALAALYGKQYLTFI